MFTVRKVSKGLYKEKGSKFISYLYPIESEKDVRNILEILRKEHSKARHHCYAFRIGGKGELERANDADEPNGSAGLPILNQLHSANLTNVLLVVVRYFGGTKLGLGGLVRAYKESAKDVVENSKLVLLEELIEINLEFPIHVVGEVERIIRSENWKLEKSDYSEICRFTVSCKLGSEEALKQMFGGLKEVKIQ